MRSIFGSGAVVRMRAAGTNSCGKLLHRSRLSGCARGDNQLDGMAKNEGY